MGRHLKGAASIPLVKPPVRFSRKRLSRQHSQVTSRISICFGLSGLSGLGKGSCPFLSRGSVYVPWFSPNRLLLSLKPMNLATQFCITPLRGFILFNVYSHPDSVRLRRPSPGPTIGTLPQGAFDASRLQRS